MHPSPASLSKILLISCGTPLDPLHNLCDHQHLRPQGYNITIGAGSYINFNCCFLDCAKITIGKNVGFPALFSPALIHLLAAC